MFCFVPETKGDRVSIELELNGSTFTLFADRPSFAQRIDDDALFVERCSSTAEAHTAAFRAQFLNRLKLIRDWDGVVDAKRQPIKFTADNLIALLGQVSALVGPLGRKLDELFAPTGSAGEFEPEEKSVESVGLDLGETSEPPSRDRWSKKR